MQVYFPFNYVLPSGLLFTFCGRTGWIVNVSSNTWGQAVPKMRGYGSTQYPYTGTSVLLGLHPDRNYQVGALITRENYSFPCLGVRKDVGAACCGSRAGSGRSIVARHSCLCCAGRACHPQITGGFVRLGSLNHFFVITCWSLSVTFGHMQAEIVLFGGQNEAAYKNLKTVASRGINRNTLTWNAASREYAFDGWSEEYLSMGRVMPDAVLLPNGKVVILNGANVSPPCLLTCCASPRSLPVYGPRGPR
jgi:hypothetical protein